MNITIKISLFALKTSLSFLMCYVETDMVRPIVTAEAPEQVTSSTMNVHLSHSPNSESHYHTIYTHMHTQSHTHFWCFWSGNLINLTIWSDQKNRLGHFVTGYSFRKYQCPFQAQTSACIEALDRIYGKSSFLCKPSQGN